VFALRDRVGLLLRRLKGSLRSLPALGLFVGGGVDELFIGRSVNIYLLAGAIIAGLFFIFIMGFIIYEMFKH
jgi:hypothetical protein